MLGEFEGNNLMELLDLLFVCMSVLINKKTREHYHRNDLTEVMCFGFGMPWF
jgi:hypothetical protein